MLRLLFATRNSAKLAQLQYVAAAIDAPIVVISARQKFGEAAAYDETGSQPADVARNGALAVAERLGEPVVAEDTILQVAALNGAPGINSGLYLQQHGRDGLLAALAGPTNRQASITSAVAWATPSGDSQTWVTTVRGIIAPVERWQRGLPDWIAPSEVNPNGGGYNSIFVPDGLCQTLAQIPPEAALDWGYREPNFCALLSFVLERQPA